MQEFCSHYLSDVKETYNLVPESLSHHLRLSDYILELNADARILNLLSAQSPHILAQQQFTRNEWAILTLILQQYPGYASHEMLLAELTSLSEAECRHRLLESQQIGPEAVKREFRPVYRALAGIRAKLNKLCPQLKISLLRCSGYVIMLAPDWEDATDQTLLSGKLSR
ncbi:hypothetical protein EPA93_17555 [Ktedonosporobacter rubrisoli]|uniref:OmpR/PhoB-type domain-containing protein n=1 Tax=Ktedonosporobacter rubrisoli TaxID=2509675 RepID=A0A4P6JQK2_KTERU|nr:hypothetical protein [Ktedonosporobacter rubrisoli]QBD77699.1 hypothetical protein EPA93_17555 [Ktedonosporobacter rubrisoli]